MDFPVFSEQVLKIKNLPLPGATSHFKLEPELRRKHRLKGDPLKKTARKAAVMALFYPKEGHTHLVLILRKEYEGVHSKQIGFPGGKVEESDSDLWDTAKRETFEEIGVYPKEINFLKALSEVYIPPSNFLVQPFMGLYPEAKPFDLDPIEVDRLVEVKVDDVLDDANLMEKRLTTSYAQDILVPAFKLNGYVVWGATAMILSEIKDLLRQLL